MTEDAVKILYGALVGVARASESNPLVNDETYDVLTGGLSAAYSASMQLPCLRDGTGDQYDLEYWTGRARKERHRLVPKCAVCANPCGRTEEYDLAGDGANDSPDLMESKQRLLKELGKAAYSAKKAHHKLTSEQEGIFAFGLFEIGYAQSSEELEEVFYALETKMIL